MLLLKNAGVNVADQHGSTPLHRAASKGNTTLVKLLLSYHANPNARDCTGSTPLSVDTTALSLNYARSSAIAEGPHDTLVSRNLATTNHPI